MSYCNAGSARCFLGTEWRERVWNAPLTLHRANNLCAQSLSINPLHDRNCQEVGLGKGTQQSEVAPGAQHVQPTQSGLSETGQALGSGNSFGSAANLCQNGAWKLPYTEPSAQRSLPG